MANLTQRITLTGAEQVRASVAAIGAAGEAAWKTLGDTRAADKGLASVGTSVAKLASDLKNTGQQFAATAQNAAAFGSAVGSALARVTGLSAGLGVALTKGLAAFKREGGLAEELQQNADAAGLSTKSFDNLTAALAQNGVGREEAAKSLDKVAKFIVKAANETDDYNKKLQDLNKKAFKDGSFATQEYRDKLRDLNDGMGDAAKLAKRYGLTLKENGDDLVNVRDFALDFGEALKEAGNDTQKAKDVLDVFGKSGRKIGQAFQSGRREIEKLEITMQGLAPAAKLVEQKALAKMDDAFDNLEAAAKSLRRSLLATFAPDVSQVVEAFTSFLSDNRKEFIDLANLLREQVRPAIDEALAALSTAAKDGTLQKVFEGAVDAIFAIGRAIRDFIIPSFKAMLAAANEAADGLNKVFGTQLTGGVLLAGLALAKFTGLLKVFTTGLSLTISTVKLLISVLPVAINLLRAFALILLTPTGALIAIGVAVGFLVVTILNQFPRVRDAIITAFTDPVKFVTGALQGIVVIATAVANAIVAAWGAVKQFFADLWAGVVAGASAVWEGIKAGATALIEFFNTTLVQPVLALFKALWDGLAQGASALWQGIKDGAQGLWDFISSTAAAPFNAIIAAAKSMYDSVTGFFSKLLEQAKQLLGLQAQASGGGGDAEHALPGFAGGGGVRGSGSGTSDSILARLSNGEWVMKAAAVKKYGAAFMHAINSMSFPQMGGGALQVAHAFTPSVPRFAAGGPVNTRSGGGGRPMVLQIGDQTIGGLSANDDAVATMTKYAASKSLRSAGRKPVWYRG